MALTKVHFEGEVGDAMKWLDKRVRKEMATQESEKNWKIGVIMDKLGTLAMDDRGAVLKFDVVKTTIQKIIVERDEVETFVRGFHGQVPR